MPQSSSARFEWYYRTDGMGTFRRGEVGSFEHGMGTHTLRAKNRPLTSPIRFGPFSIVWRPNQRGKGWIEYEHNTATEVVPSGMGICVTNETDVEKIDATDPKWLYKASPDDPGVTASGKPK